ncbi:histidine kinase [Arcicella aquatica]|uniref:Histidine kinase n=1 Tax=Arcicella aquatica TaxID=217141 RepID=A0ABU5QMY1_9BACT|nr:histidine kinase [Arcicella aquatica]MEA5258421.1 histidine kinase [Arcicella aquatica]
MSFLEKIFGKEAVKIGNYLGLSFIAAMLLFTIFMAFADIFFKNNDDEIALISTILLLIGVFVGRFLASLWQRKHISNLVFIVLIGLTFALIVSLMPIIDTLITHQEFLVVAIALIIYFVISILIGLLIKLTRMRTEQKLDVANTSALHSQSELQLLQSQLSPHFLFNTLNNLYGLSLTDHQKIPNLLLKLSDLLRYSVYDAKDIMVPLTEEINYIKNYIDFEKIRLGVRLNLKTDFEESNPQKPFKIAPMLLIVFVENAFKHSKNSLDNVINIEINLKTWGNSILFSVVNSHNNIYNDKQKHSGFGLDNVKKRLDLIYKGEYDLEINETTTNYEVKLRINGK